MIPGIHFGIDAATYRAADGVNISSLKEMGISAKHYLTAITEPPKPPTDAQKIGTAVHAAVLEDDHSGYVIRPEGMKFTTKEGKEWRDKQSKPIITTEDVENLSGMVAAIKKHLTANQILYDTNGNNEVCCWKKDMWTELLKKGRCDRLTMDAQNKMVIIDLKTTDRGGASENEFKRSIVKWGYAAQAAYYMDLFEASFFIFVCVEKLAPFAVNCFALAPEAIEVGRKQYQTWLAKVRECQDSGIWPAYGDGLNTITLPEWALPKEL